MTEKTESLVDEVSELLLIWEERRQCGDTITVDELCVERPELAAEVRRRIQALELMYGIPNRATSKDGADETRPSPPRDSTPTVPGFEILGKLGHGGMGVVYRARHQRLHRLCAVKMLRFDGLSGPMERMRFRIEAEAVAALQHPHIVQLFEIGDAGDSPFLVLEYVEGSTLAERIRSQPVPIATAVDLMQVLAQAVDFAHHRGIVHRDLKPSNVLLSADGTPKISDFGLAKRLSQAAESMAGGGTATGAVFGTPSYMAPEQALGRTREVGPAADVYSLGAILYELLTGRPPFQADSVLELMERVRSQEPMPLRRLRPEVPRDLEIICLKCLEKEPDKRYASAAALADDLLRFQSHEPIRARPVSWWEQTAKWARRRPAIAGLLSAVVLLLFVSAVGGSTLAFIAFRERANALLAADHEKKAKDAAETREAEKTAVLSFVENRIFAAARPLGQMGGLGRDVSLRRAVEDAVPYLDKSFADKPLIEARLRLTLGTSFWYLSDGRKSAQQNERARDLYTAHLGPDAPETLTSMNNLAISYDMLGRYDEALALRQVTLERRRATLGPAHNDTVGSMNNLAISYENQGHHADALKLKKEVLELDIANLGPDHPDTLRSMSNLANSHADLGEYEDAFILHEKVLARRRVVLEKDHPDTLLSMVNLGMDLSGLERYAEALELQKEALVVQEVKLGPDHQHTMVTLNNMGVTLADLDRHDEALDIRKKLLALREGKLGREHRATLHAKYMVAVSYAELKRYAEALDLHQETLKLHELHLPPDHPDTLWSMKEVAYCLVQLERGTEAIPIIDNCVQRALHASVKPALVRQAMDLRLRHFKKSNDLAGCLDTIEKWEKLNRTDAKSLYTSACMHAVTAAVFRATSGVDSTRLADEEDGRAMDWLQRAVAAGYTDAAHLVKDKDLDALRDREDFTKLLADLTQRRQNNPP